MTGASATARAAASPLRGRWSLWEQPTLLLTLAALLWASNFVLGRAVPLAMSPVSISFWRWALAVPFMLPIALPHLVRDWPVIRRGWPMLLLLAGLGLAGSNTLAYYAVRMSGATPVLLVQSAIPVAIVVLGLLLFGDRPVPRQLATMACALAGVLCVVLGRPGASGSLNLGTLLACCTMLAQSLYVTLLRKRPRVHATSFLFLTVAGAALLMLPFQLAMGTALPIGNPGGLAVLCYLALGPSILAFFLFNRGVALVGSARAGLFFYLMPIFGTVLAIVFLGEAVTGAELAGFALVVAGFALSSGRRS